MLQGIVRKEVLPIFYWGSSTTLGLGKNLQIHYFSCIQNL